MRGSSVNPVDNGIAAGLMKDMVPHEFPVTLGPDFAGVVEQVGADVTAVSAGDEVIGFVPAMGPTVHAGSKAGSIVVPEAGLTRTPDGVDAVTAGAASLAAVTAAMCVDALDLSPGDTVLIVGATGGVGSGAAQLAAAAGATVPPACPKTSSTCTGSASQRSCRATQTSSPLCASVTPTVSTRSSTSSTMRPAATTPHSGTAAGSPRPPAPPARAPVARSSWPRHLPRSSGASRSTSPTER